jgi:hypothetical protein
MAWLHALHQIVIFMRHGICIWHFSIEGMNSDLLFQIGMLDRDVCGWKLVTGPSEHGTICWSYTKLTS